MTSRPARPRGETDNRQRLLHSARALFIRHPYHQVALRQVAREAGVDAALIRYYSGTKAGLLEAVLRDVIEPALQGFRKTMLSKTMPGNNLPRDITEHQAADSIDTMIGIYYRSVIGPDPDMPRLIARLLSDPQNEEPFRVASQVFMQVINTSRRWVNEVLTVNGRLQPGTDPEVARLSFFSLMMFPFIAPPMMVEHFGFRPTPELLSRLGRHNSRVLTHGLLNPDNPPTETRHSL